MPSVVVASPALADGCQLVGHIQAEARGGVPPPELGYFLGISVPADDKNFPEPSEVQTAPEWVAHLKRLYHGVLKGRDQRLLVSTSRPNPGRTELGARKLPLAEKFLPDDQQWLAKGYTDGWGLGIRSQKRELDRAEDLAAPFVRILSEW
ncbi:hypothetical protein GCM10009594_17210 [Kocuria palustris]|uniref:hypothetical protein n=1 Tax=Kocuria palustris TaxID=71999 RepID=UPI00195EB1ED|nr:hypothetical protein [Kocuria palustris]MBM7822775.1 hypothetical protein [Kocuria palustris]